MYRIEDNGQVMKQEKTETYEVWTPIGMEIQPIVVEETNTYTKHKWGKFNLETGEYKPDTDNLNPIIVDGVAYELIDGVATVPKIAPVDPLKILGQQLAEEKIKNIQNSIVINQLGQELTNIKLKCWEVCNMAFWQLAYKMNWVDSDKLRLVVKTESNPFGEITPEDYKNITGQEF